jgi:nucleoside 2-deoxyribosyltransferase
VKTLKVYVAGSSKQLERAADAMGQIKAAGHYITHNWVRSIEEAGAANPPETTPAQRNQWALECLRGVYECDVLLLLVTNEAESFGMPFEMGFAYSEQCHAIMDQKEPKRIVTSGTCDAIFVGLANAHYDRDDKALAAEFGVVA